MQNIWIIIGRFSPLHIWHISLINYSLNTNNKTIVIIWSAQIIDEKNPYSILERKQIITSEFWNNLILDTLDDYESNEEWISKLKSIILKYWKLEDNINFLWWDLNNDYAIEIIKQYKELLDFNTLSFQEKSRQEIPISATKIRALLKEKNYKEAKKWLSKKTTLLIFK